MKKKEIIKILNDLSNEASTSTIQETRNKVKELLVDKEIEDFKKLFQARNIRTNEGGEALINEFASKWKSICDEDSRLTVFAKEMVLNMVYTLCDISNFFIVKKNMELRLKRNVTDEEVNDIIKNAKKRIEAEKKEAENFLETLWRLGSGIQENLK